MAGKTKNQQRLQFQRRFTKEGVSPFDQFEYDYRTSIIRNPSGEVVFEMNNVEVPKHWSQIATDILAQKYFRKAGVPQADGSLGRETSSKQVAHRMANCWRVWGERNNYFNSEADAQVFYEELVYSILNQMCVPNSPQWFNTGLHESYGIKGKPQGHYYVDAADGVLKKSTSAYERPQPHACFILSVSDDLVNDGGIMDLWVREARIFKYGSGVGTNFSTIRGENEKLSGGGSSSGLMSFLKIGDRAAGAIKSGGTTRRAAKMVCLDLDHPEIMEFINWKVEEEKKVGALINAGYASDYEGEAYRTVSGQNSNNSVRIPNEFFEKLEKGEDWELKARTDGRTMKKIPSHEVWNQIAYAAWRCADPGTQYDTTINEWHTSPKGGRINASNPCSEYMFLDNTACNLASVNLRRLFDEATQTFDVEGFEYVCRLWTVVLEISVLMAQFPSKEVAQLSYDYRTLGLGYANLGSMLMVMGIPYDSEEGRGIAGAITAIMTGISYKTSAEMASFLGAFPRYEENAEDMLRVMRNHRAAAYDAEDAFVGLSIKPLGIKAQYCPDYMLTSACKSWDDAVSLGEKYGYRNAQTTVIAPTGTIGLVMDCDTTGVEPDFALVKFKKLSGGGYFKIINQSVPAALAKLGYNEREIDAIIKYAVGAASLNGAPHINPQTLSEKGFIAEAYYESWKLGLKACALYRDGSKLSQPLSTKGDKKKKDNADASAAEQETVVTESTMIDMGKLTLEELLEELNSRVQSSPDTKLKRQLARIVERRTLPAKRRGFTQKAKINGQTLFLRTGEYADGTVGEIFVDLAKEGSTLRSLMNSFAIAISVGLQYGVPLEEYVEKFVFTKFEPSGMVDHPNIKTTTSIVDFVFRCLAYEYLGRTDLVHVLDKPDVMNTGTDDWDDVPTGLEYEKKTPELSDVRVVGVVPTTPQVQKTQRAKVEASMDASNYAKKSMQSDAPACTTCGHIMMRSGACYKCDNCGTQGGCS